MLQKLSIIYFILILTLSFQLLTGQNEKKPEINVVYGEKHIFTIATPINWINDKELAQKIGLVCFFYPNKDKIQNKKNYFYANGIDKDSLNETLTDFVNGDLEKFRNKYPDLTFEKVPVEFTDGIRNGVLYSFSNLTDRFKEEVIYAETDDAFLIFSFAAMTDKDYEDYQAVFDKFIASFKYRGNNPKPFIDYLKRR